MAHAPTEALSMSQGSFPQEGRVSPPLCTVCHVCILIYDNHPWEA